MDSNKKKGRSILILLLVIITLTAVTVTVWALFCKDTAPELAPDYAPVEEESNAEPVDDGQEKMEAAKGGGAVSLTYSSEVNVSLTEGQASLLFINPSKSVQDMVLQIVIDDTVIVQSGTLKPGNQVTVLDLLEGTEEQLREGGYDGNFVVLYYDPESGEKAVVNTEIPVSITVSQ